MKGTLNRSFNRKKNQNNEQKLSSENTGETGDSELQEYLEIRRQRRRIFPRAALVGACAGLLALLFRIGLSGADQLRNSLLAWAHSQPALGWVFPVLFAMLGAGISVALTRRFAPEASGSGIPHLEAVLLRMRKFHWKRLLPVKFFGGIIAIGGGLALGREGPTVQMGGAVGDAVGRWLKVSRWERMPLIAAGAGAGLAAAFNAPLSGLIFVLEEVRRDFQPIVFGTAFIAAVVADIVARLGTGQFPVFTVPSYPVPPLASLPVFALLGILTGALGVFFNRALLATANAFGRLPERFILPAAVVTGGIAGLAGWFSPLVVGSGHEIAEAALQGELMLAAIPLFFAVRFFLTTASYGTGAPGGIFAPLLGLGALIGLAVGQIAHNLAPSIVPIPAVFAVVGMAAYFTAIVRAPLTGIMLIVEMTGNYSQMLPLLVSCFSAYLVAEFLKEMPIYEALLERDLKRGVDLTLNEPAVAEFVVQPGSPFDGRQVRSLGLPPGCILVRISEGKQERIPRANTRLKANMHITAIVAPEAAVGFEVLHRGCAACTAEDKKGNAAPLRPEQRFLR